MKLCILLIVLAACASAQMTWTGPGGGSIPSNMKVLPSGMVLLVLSGTCPAMTTEISALNGKFLQGTIAANNDVGQGGGNATITPTGSVSQPALTMNSYTPAGSVAAPTFTGSAGTVPAETFTGSAGTVPAETFTGSAMATHSHGAGTLTDATSGSTVKLFTASGSGVSAATLSGSTAAVSAGTPAGTNSTASFTPAGTNSTASFIPAGTNSTASFTPNGTNSAPAFTGTPATLTGSVSQPSFAGNAIDQRPQFVKVIFCSVN